MTARQFGFVIARGLAVYVWFLAILGIRYVIEMTITAGRNFEPGRMIALQAVFTAIYILVGAFLWTGADKFAGPVADATIEPKPGDWTVKLAFQVVGILLMVLGAVALCIHLGHAFWMHDLGLDRSAMPEIASYSVQILFGLGLFAFNRFTRPAY